MNQFQIALDPIHQDRSEVDNEPVSVPRDTGFVALMTLAAVHGLQADEARLRHEFGAESFSTRTILLAAKSLGLVAQEVRQPVDRLDKVPLPAIAVANDGSFFVLAALHGEHLYQRRAVVKPAEGPIQIQPLDEFLAAWSGLLILCRPADTKAQRHARFDFTWFIPAVVKYRRLLCEVLLMSLVLQLIGLVTPLFFQVVMDKVLVNHAMRTLDVIVFGLVAAHVFEAVLTGVRTWVFAHTSSKIDVELGAKLFRHLIALPLAYFQSRRVGDSVSRVRELENIRSFLTGNAITVVLDLAFSMVFLGVMLLYSPVLTLVVAMSIPLYVGLSALFTPIIRTRLDEKFNSSAENNAFLVETLNGIDTVKALAVEPRWTRKWDQQLAAYVTAGLAATNVSTIASNAVTLVSKLVTAAILWLGASLVIDDKMTVGGLVAFNMLASQVSSPVLRLAQLWNDFQQVGISMGRLGDILNARSELSSQGTQLPKLAGEVVFDRVSFRYKPESPEVLRNVSLRVAPGEVIGIVGRSGSGKSTLTRLVQRMYVPEHGRVFVDGHDLGTVDAVSLRRQIGVVLQENMLFNRTIRDNIALVDPAPPLEAVIEVAKLAGAHEFICALPHGYGTVVGEHGTGLSGGQRQRIAIARALIGNPPILVFDEATSALDYESEKVIQDNMRRICAGRTVLVIAHRLSAVRDADRIVVMDRGEIAEQGTHNELLRTAGIYAHLHALQHGLREVTA